MGRHVRPVHVLPCVDVDTCAPTKRIAAPGRCYQSMSLRASVLLRKLLQMSLHAHCSASSDQWGSGWAPVANPFPPPPLGRPSLPTERHQPAPAQQPAAALLAHIYLPTPAFCRLAPRHSSGLRFVPPHVPATDCTCLPLPHNLSAPPTPPTLSCFARYFSMTHSLKLYSAPIMAKPLAYDLYDNRKRTITMYGYVQHTQYKYRTPHDAYQALHRARAGMCTSVLLRTAKAVPFPSRTGPEPTPLGAAL